jgi:hypothetical protein
LGIGADFSSLQTCEEDPSCGSFAAEYYNCRAMRAHWAVASADKLVSENQSQMKVEDPLLVHHGDCAAGDCRRDCYHDGCGGLQSACVACLSLT